MKHLILSVAIIQIISLLKVTGQGNRCDFLHFDSQQLLLGALGHSETYVFTRLPRSSCTGVVLNYINFCFLLARPRPSSRIEMVSEVSILIRQNNQFNVSGIIPIMTQTSYCEGDMVQFKSQSLCCISKHLADILSFLLEINLGELGYTIALRGPTAEGITAYVPMGYTDYRTAGYITTARPVLGSYLDIATDLPPGYPLLPVISFSQSPASYVDESTCPTEIPSMATNLTTETCMSTLKQATSSHTVAAVTILAIVLAIFVSISVILGIILLGVTWKRNCK